MPERSELLITLENAGINGAGHWLVRGVAMEIAAGEIVTLIGLNGSMPCTSISSMVEWRSRSSTICRRNCVKNRTAASVTSNINRTRNNPIRTKVWPSSNWSETPSPWSYVWMHGKNGVCSTWYYRTASGTMEKCSPPSVNPLIYC